MKNNKLATIGTITLAGAVLLSSPLTAAYATNEFCEQETHAWEDVDHDQLCDICGGGLMDLPAGADLGDSLGKGRTEGDYIPNIEPDENDLPDLPSGADILDSLLKGRKEGDYIPSIEPKAQAKTMAYSVLKEYPYETDLNGQHDDSTHDFEDLDHDQVCDLCGGEGLPEMPIPTPDDAIGKECPSMKWSDHYDEGNGFCRCGMDIKYAGVSHIFEDDNRDFLCDVCGYAYDPFGDSLGKGKHPGGDIIPDIGTESTESTESTEETESSEIPSTEETESTETESTETPSTEETESTETPSTEETESTETESTEEPSTESTEEPSTESTEEPSTESTEEPSTEETESTETESTEEPSTESTEEPSTESTEEPSTESTEEPSTESTEEPSTITSEEPSTITEQPSTVTTVQPSTVTEQGKTESNEIVKTSDTQNKNYGMYFLISALGCSLPVFKKFFVK